MDVITAAILAIAIPFVFAAIAPALSKASPKLQGWLATVGILISAVLVAWITPAVLRAKGPIVASYAWIPQAGVHFALYLDPLGILLALIASGFGFLALLYSVDDMEHEHGLGRYYMWMLMFIGSMVGLVLAGDLLLLFVFWEMTSLTSYGLIGFYKERREDVSAALKAFVLTHVGGIFLLFGIFIAYLNTGTFLFSDIAAKGFPVGKEFWAGVAIASFLIGAIAKSVQFPMHNWLPSATVAPSAVTALLHAAAMVKAGVYLVARMYTLFPEFMAASWHLVVVLIGAVTMVVGVMNALVQTGPEAAFGIPHDKPDWLHDNGARLGHDARHRRRAFPLSKSRSLQGLSIFVRWRSNLRNRLQKPRRLRWACKEHAGDRIRPHRGSSFHFGHSAV
ncbi:MAG: Membrane H+-translocase/NADH:ubiquinone oxidoreductase subunit 5 /Multisubunit Na+/H+ antiporter [Candidatus Alkanophagales archaeon MCA70_species_2]|nr:Membrane H+-translocase/NADH:ubiquinone oxidoreductase subunit 5 /Multisubunit Na+/H+ antiporter [Candidatus Alkanophaga liquidiphilum]